MSFASDSIYMAEPLTEPQQTTTTATQMDQTSRLTVESVVNAPIADVWTLYVTPSDIKEWNTASPDWHTTAATVDLRVGGNFVTHGAKDGSFCFDFAERIQKSCRTN